MKKNYILALDQSSSQSGFAILNSKANIIEYGVWDKTKVGNTTDLGHAEKRYSLKQDIKNILKENPDIIQVVCEGTYKNNTKVLKILSKVQGSVEDICYELNMPCFTFENANEWRKYLPVKISGKRDQCKEQTKKYILSQYPKLPDNLLQDVYDAIAIGIAYLSIFVA